MNASPHLATRSTVVVVGDVMVDTFVIIDRPLSTGVDHPMRLVRRVGGQAANTSAWLAWSGSSVHLVAGCGDDEEGAWVDNRLQTGGVTTHLVRNSEPTGSCIVIVDPSGERTMFSSPGANGAMADIGRQEVASVWERLGSTQVAHLHLSGYLLDRDPAIVADLARHVPDLATVSLDTAAFHPDGVHRRALDEALAHLDVLIGTAGELSAFLDSGSSTVPDVPALVRAWRERFPGVVVVKEGAAGASALADGELVRSPAQATEVVDTTGAGDAFTAGFLAAWVLDRTAIPEALSSAIHTASRALGRVGADPPAQEGR